MKILVREGDTVLECECPVDSCDTCKLRFRCYTSRSLSDLSLAEKKLLLYSLPLGKIKIIDEGCITNK
jgi:hypothetical protein